MHLCFLSGKGLNFAATSISTFFFQVEKQQDCLIYNSWHPRVLTKRHNIRSERFWGMLLSLFRNFIENVWRSLWWNGRWVLVRRVLKKLLAHWQASSYHTMGLRQRNICSFISALFLNKETRSSSRRPYSWCVLLFSPRRIYCSSLSWNSPLRKWVICAFSSSEISPQGCGPNRLHVCGM